MTDMKGTAERIAMAEMIVTAMIGMIGTTGMGIAMGIETGTVIDMDVVGQTNMTDCMTGMKAAGPSDHQGMTDMMTCLHAGSMMLLPGTMTPQALTTMMTCLLVDTMKKWCLPTMGTLTIPGSTVPQEATPLQGIMAHLGQVQAVHTVLMGLIILAPALAPDCTEALPTPVLELCTAPLTSVLLDPLRLLLTSLQLTMALQHTAHHMGLCCIDGFLKFLGSQSQPFLSVANP